MALTGCGTTTKTPLADNPATLVARFYLETKPGEPGLPAALPRSGLVINVVPRPVLVEYDVLNAEVAQVDLGRCLLVQLTPAAGRDLYRLSVASVGRRLVLALNDRFLGARRIEGAMGDGSVLIFLEIPDEELPDVVDRLKLTAAEVAALARKARKS